jgi:glycosyltransferase involved in cell wall biosynthesis
MSLSSVGMVIYVDSGSSDGSAKWAASSGADVIELDISLPFTAARARNVGFRRLFDIAPEVSFVQFVDGDCEIDQTWIETAFMFLTSHTEMGAVSGKLRELHPDRSIYNWMCDLEWNGPTGEVSSFGGIVMIRADAFKAVGGFRDDVIAGEEPELAIRLRASGWRLWRLGCDMAVHDVAIVRFRQWWRRALRCGYAFANGACLHGAPPERHWVWETRRAWIWGLWLPLGCLTAGLMLGPWGWATWLIYPLQMVRQASRNTGSLKQRVTLAAFQLLGRFPEAIGQIKFTRDRLLRRGSQLIEYK